MLAEVLPLEIEETDAWALDALTTRAIRLALWPERDGDDPAGELVTTSHGSRRLLTLAIARVERALAAEPSGVATRADELLRAARSRLDRG